MARGTVNAKRLGRDIKDGMASNEIATLVEQLKDAASRLDALAKGMENGVVLRKQLAEKF